MRREVEIGVEYGRLTVLSRSAVKNSSGRPQWNCKCCCGNPDILVKSTAYLLSLASLKSCGCLFLEKRRATHIARLARYGRVELVGEYTGDKDVALYRCLIHDEIHPSIPSNTGTGSGLKCCFQEAVLQSNRRSYERAKAKFLENIEGRFELRSEYRGAMHKVLLYCIEHKECHFSDPYMMTSRGSGTKCCGLSALKNYQKQVNAKARSEYAAKLSRIGRVECIGFYIDSSTPVLHRCLIHGEIYPAVPANLLQGYGLICCREAGKRIVRDQAKTKAEEELIKYCEQAESRVQYLDGYDGAHAKARFLCKTHNQIHFADPHSIKKGQGLSCCRRGGSDFLDNALDGSLRWKDEPEWLYLFHLSRFSGYVKLGIAKDYSGDASDDRILRRDQDPEYGEEICIWYFDTRLDAFLVEEALFYATIQYQDYPKELEGWGGFTEIRKCDADLLKNIAQGLVDDFHELGKWLFVLTHIPMTTEQKERVRFLLQESVTCG
jgi:hypothetical protein